MGLFSSKAVEPEPRPSHRINYPDDVAVETEEATYFIKSGARIKFPSDAVFQSWSLVPVRSSESACGHLPLSKKKMGFRNGSLIVDFSDNKIYFISAGKRRLVTSPLILDELNLEATGAIIASHADVLLHEEGESLD